jgi:glycosyltransferase involved in cell wall biosynthesis
MDLPISVITCSHNPRADYLVQVHDALKHQTLAKDRWEYLLIDNRSDEQLESRVDLSWHPNSRQVREEKLGLTHARLRGIHESSGQILVFVDDDNVLDANFLDQTLNIANEWPKLGAWSGQTRPGFEASPPEWTRLYWGNLVIRSLEKDVWSNLPHLPETMPCGAGLCVRRAVADHYVFLHESGQRRLILDRTGDSLISAGDNDLAACACDVGLGVGLYASLKLTHLIPSARLEEDYLLRLVESIAYSGVIFRSFRSTTDSYHQGWPRRLADSLRLLRMNQRQRRFFRASKRGESEAAKYLEELQAGAKARQSRGIEPVDSIRPHKSAGTT